MQIGLEYTTVKTDKQPETGRYFSRTNDFWQEFFVFFAIAVYSFLFSIPHTVYSNPS